jgi:hypothetical protein
LPTISLTHLLCLGFSECNEGHFSFKICCIFPQYFYIRNFTPPPYLVMGFNFLFPLNYDFSHHYLIKTKAIIALSFSNISISSVACLA